MLSSRTGKAQGKYSRFDPWGLAGIRVATERFDVVRFCTLGAGVGVGFSVGLGMGLGLGLGVGIGIGLGTFGGA